MSPKKLSYEYLNSNFALLAPEKSFPNQTLSVCGLFIVVPCPFPSLKGIKWRQKSQTQSHSHPWRYPANLNCIWKTAGQNEFILSNLRVKVLSSCYATTHYTFKLTHTQTDLWASKIVETPSDFITLKTRRPIQMTSKISSAVICQISQLLADLHPISNTLSWSLFPPSLSFLMEFPAQAHAASWAVGRAQSQICVMQTLQKCHLFHDTLHPRICCNLSMQHSIKQHIRGIIQTASRSRKAI